MVEKIPSLTMNELLFVANRLQYLVKAKEDLSSWEDVNTRGGSILKTITLGIEKCIVLDASYKAKHSQKLLFDIENKLTGLMEVFQKVDPEIKQALAKVNKDQPSDLEVLIEQQNLEDIVNHYMLRSAEIRDQIMKKAKTPKTGPKNQRTHDIATYAARYYWSVTGKIPITPSNYANQALEKTVRSICEQFWKDPEGRHRDQIRGVRTQCKEAVLNLQKHSANLTAPYI
jgi:hypothetical protein